MHVLSLCAGAGGGDLALRLAVRSARTVCYVEREAYLCELLATRGEEESLDAAPVWTDVKTFDGKPWRGKVDCILAGYPCQPFSCAGKRRGAEDPRHLWPDVRRIIGEIEPWLVFIENVAEHLRLGFDVVRNELQGMGYVVEAGLFSAEEVGAPQERCRLFALAYCSHADRRPSQSLRSGRDAAEHGRGELADADRRQREQCGWSQQTQGDGESGVSGSDGSGSELENPSRHGEPGQEGQARGSGRGRARPGSSQLADPRNGLIQEPRSGAEGRDGAGSASEELEHAISARTPSWLPAQAGRFSQLPESAEPDDTDDRLVTPFPFPPHRTGDWQRWEYVLDNWPYFRPAISRFDLLCIAARFAGISRVGLESTPEELDTALRAAFISSQVESRFRQLVNELALVVDERINQLRACGNAIVPLQAAFAFRLLAERAGIDLVTL